MEQKEKLFPEESVGLAEGSVEQAAKNEEISETLICEETLADNIDAVETVAESDVPPVENSAIETAAPKQGKKISTKLMIIIGGALAVAVIAFLIVFFSVIRPNGIYKDAVDALDRGDFSECERLINQIPNHKDVPSLKRDLNLALAKRYIENGDLDIAETLLASMPGDERATALRVDISYCRAEDLVKREEYDEAKALLDKIPNHDDPLQLRKKINYESAMASVETGDYETAYDLLSALGTYEDAAEQKDIVYYEALAFKSLFNIQSTLKNPASMRVTKVIFYKDSSNEGELDAIFEFNATNSYGGSLGAYGYDLTLYDESEDSGMISHSSYVDPDDYYDVLLQMIVDAVKLQEAMDITVDVARMNRLIVNNATFKIDLPFQSSAVAES